MALICDDAVCFALGGSERADYERYQGEEFRRLREYYFAVFMHGNKLEAGLQGDPYRFAPWLKRMHEERGRGRAVLLITCWAGWTFANPLATAANLSILAGLSPVFFEATFSGGKMSPYYIRLGDKNYMKNQGNTEAFKPAWVYYESGHIRETLPGGPKLDYSEAIKMAKKHGIKPTV